MPKIDRLPSGSYRMRVYLGKTPEGKIVQRVITAPSKAQLKALAAQLRADFRPSSHGKTFGQAVGLYLDSCEATLSPSTIRGYRSLARRLQALPLWSVPLASVGKAEVQQAIDLLSVSEADKTPPALRGRDYSDKYKKGRMSPKTIKNCYGLITAVLTRYDITVSGVKLPQKTRPSLTVPDDSDMLRIIEAARGTALEVPILLAASGGLRRGEICALTLDDLDGTTLHIYKSMVKDPSGKWVIKAPKTYGSDRYVEIHPYLADLIRKQGYVVRCTPSTLSDNHARFLARHGLPHIRLHDYRHHMVSALHAAGISDAYIQQRGGWASDYTVKAVYRHTLADHEAEAVQATHDHFDALMGPC